MVSDVRRALDGDVLAFGTIDVGGAPVTPFTLRLSLREDGKVVRARALMSDERTMDRLGRLDPE
jgi:hypothetical protein